MVNLECQFSEPKCFNGNEPETKQEIWNYSKMTCTSTDTGTSSKVALIQNQETGSEFYLDKTLDYGEIFILFFFLLFLIFGLGKAIMDFWIPHRVIRKN